MKKHTFKTNINCSNCLRTVSPFLNEQDNIDLWKVDLDDTNKILEVVLEDNNKMSVIEAVTQAGFEIEEI